MARSFGVTMCLMANIYGISIASSSTGLTGDYLDCDYIDKCTVVDGVSSTLFVTDYNDNLYKPVMGNYQYFGRCSSVDYNVNFPVDISAFHDLCENDSNQLCIDKVGITITFDDTDRKIIYVFDKHYDNSPTWTYFSQYMFDDSKSYHNQILNDNIDSTSFTLGGKYEVDISRDSFEIKFTFINENGDDVHGKVMLSFIKNVLIVATSDCGTDCLATYACGLCGSL